MYHSVNELKAELIDFKIVFAYNSNVIENPETSFHTTREIFEEQDISYFSGNLRALFEIINQKECYEYLLDKIVNKEPLSVELIKAIHYKLTKGTYDEIRHGEEPGEFKKHDYGTARNQVRSNPEDVEKNLNDLISEVNSIQGENMDYYTVAVYFHANFESIHLFADGNGRVGRTLVNYYLLINNKRSFVVYNENKSIYYDCLEKYDEEENLDPLIKFLKYEQQKYRLNQSLQKR